MVVVKLAELLRTFDIFMTLIDPFVPLSEISHIGSPATASCMVVGRIEKPDTSF